MELDHDIHSSPAGFGWIIVSKAAQGGLAGTAGFAATGTASRFAPTWTNCRRSGFAGTTTGTDRRRCGLAGTAAGMTDTGFDDSGTRGWGGLPGNNTGLAATTHTRLTDTGTHGRRDGFAGCNNRLTDAGTTARRDRFAGTSQAMIITPMTTAPMIVKIALIDMRRIPGTTAPDMVAVTLSPITGYSFIPGREIPIISPSVIMVFGTIPMAAPGSPPPTSLEKQFHLNIGNRIHIGSGQHNHIRR
ncbi:MAG: hypothetical protein JXL20_07985 [Deltaproteobacteria bacterium]|nr:hypothetical protein [Deltaproteobacteria bacterium]